MAQAIATVPTPSTPSAATAAAAAADAAPEGRRREPRAAVDRPIVIISLSARGGMRFHPGRLIDCSPHGLGVLLSRPLPLGDRFMVQSRLRRSVLLLYTVRNCRRWQNGFRVGAEFSGVLGEPNAPDAADPIAAQQAPVSAPPGP